MRGLLSGGAMAAMAASTLMMASTPYAAASVMPSAPRVAEPGRGKKRLPVATVEGRRIGRRYDPYFRIKSKGRHGARQRAGEMAIALASRRARRGTPNAGKVFVSDNRQAAFAEAIAFGVSRNKALKIARRIAA